MAEIKNPDFIIWHASAHAGEGPFPNSRETLFTEAIETLEGQLMASNRAAWANRQAALRYRRQRNVLIGVLTSVVVSSYIKARERHESRRVNPSKVDYTGRM